MRKRNVRGRPSRAIEREDEEARTKPEQQLSKLPADLLLLQVFSRLPLPCIYLFRVLSKKWRARLSSAPFLRAWSSLHAADRWLVVGDVRYDAPDKMPSDPKLFAYDYCPPSLAAAGSSRGRRISCCSWLQLPVFSPGPRLLPRPLYPFVMSYDLIADSAGGLVCAIARIKADIVPARARPGRHPRTSLPPADAAVQHYWNYGGTSKRKRFTLVVFNPLTGQSRALPAPPSTVPFACEHSLQEIDPHSLMITMLAAPSATSSYLVILCCHHSGAKHCSGGMVIFSSQTNSWTSVPASEFLQKISITAGSMLDDQGWRSSHDLILRADLLEWNAESSLIMGCSLQPEVTWWEMPGPSPLEPAPNAVPLFFLHHGRLLFAWLLLSGFLAVGFTVWELQPWGSSCINPSRMNWVILAETPADLRKPIGGSEEEEAHKTDPPADYKFMHSGGLICLMIANFSDEIRDYVDEKDFVSSLTYDLDRGSWSRLPSVDEASELGMLFVGSFCFQPNFTAMV